MSILKDKMTGDEMRELLDKKHAWDDGIHNREFINDVRRHNWVLINNYPLAKLGSVEDPYDRIIDPDDDYAMRDSDLSEPIVIAPDRKTVLDGNHRVYKAREIGKTQLPAYFPMVKENKFNFKLVDKEISEARLYRTTSSFSQLTGESVAELLYLNTLVTYLMYKDEKQRNFAMAYAKQSTQYGKYTLFRSHATDLYLLAYMVSEPKTKNVKLRNYLQSKSHLNSLNFDKRTHWSFLQRVSKGTMTDTVASPYMFRLESQLKIKKSMYKQWRRLIMDWENLRYIQRQTVTARILQEFRRLGRGSEVMTPLSTMVKYKKYKVPQEFKKPSLTKRVAGTAAGAVAGRYVGKKIAKRFGKDVDKYKKAGTGLGAIAGYWASGRKKRI